MNEVNRGNTAAYQLLHQNVESRDIGWWEQLAGVIREASFVSASAEPVVGSDGHQYRVTYFEGDKPGQPSEFLQLLEQALSSGVGLIVQDKEGKTWCVFSYGALLSLRLYGAFYRLDESREREALPESEEPVDVLVVTPEEEFLPVEARKAIASFMRDDLGIEEPLFLGIIGVEGSDQMLLGFNLFQEDFPEEGEFDSAMSGLAWFLPSHYDLIVVTPDSTLAEAFAELEPTSH